MEFKGLSKTAYDHIMSTHPNAQQLSDFSCGGIEPKGDLENNIFYITIQYCLGDRHKTQERTIVLIQKTEEGNHVLGTL